jgi:LysR family transcriptional regulator, transcription activator of glutamate synthase operon
MDIEHLKEFVVLAQTGNFLEAADILYSSQSSLSKHIKSLELELGVPLFDRTTRKVSISKFGQVFLPYARQMVELQDKFVAVLKSSLDTDTDTLTVGSIPALAQYGITDVLVSFKKNRPQSMLNVLQAGSDELKEMLRKGKCELAFIRFADETADDLVRIPYAIDALVAVLPLAHPLAGQKTVPLPLLAEDELLLIAKQNYLNRLCMNACRQSGFEPKVAFTDHNVGVLVDLVTKGMGVALLMKRVALYAANPESAIVNIVPDLTTRIDLCCLKDAALSEAAKTFLQCTGYQSANMGLLDPQGSLTQLAP